MWWSVDQVVTTFWLAFAAGVVLLLYIAHKGLTWWGMLVITPVIGMVALIWHVVIIPMATWFLTP